jgi:hypothetical protein
MKQLIALSALAAAAIAPSLAHAATMGTSNPVHPLIGLAITGGGDKIASVEFRDGESRDITAGGLVQVWGGVEYREQGSPFAFQGTFGYHVDSTNADNGSQRFERFPIELIALYSFEPKFRLGVGARYATSAKFRSSGAGDVGDFNFKSQLAPMLLGEWLITPHVGLQLRYVHETYKLDGFSIDGSHGGVGVNYYF